MTTWALTNAGIYVDSHDFTGDSNQVMLACEGVANNRTTFRSGGWTELNMGVKKSTLTASGFGSFGADSVDEFTFAALGAVGKPATIVGIEDEGQPAYMLQSLPTTFSTGGQFGENVPYSLNGAGSDGVGVVKGVLLKEWGTVSATGALGTGVQLGAVGASQFAYSTIHLFGTAGTSITVVIESAAANTFSGATTRITHGSHTTVGGRWGTRAAGAITDTWWRARVSAISGTWTIAVAAGIQ